MLIHEGYLRVRLAGNWTQSDDGMIVLGYDPEIAHIITPSLARRIRRSIGKALQKHKSDQQQPFVRIDIIEEHEAHPAARGDFLPLITAKLSELRLPPHSALREFHQAVNAFCQSNPLLSETLQ